LFESVSRGASPLDEASKAAAVGKRFDVSDCIGEASVPEGSVAIQLRIASSGAPLDARPTSSSLDERMTRCVVELGCQLKLPPTSASGDLEIRAAISQVKPVFNGAVSVSASPEGAYSEALQPALNKVGQTIRPLAEACAKKTPPAASLSFSQRLVLDGAGFLSLAPPSIGGATGAIATCISAGLHDAVGPVPIALRKSVALRTSFSFSASHP